MDREDHATFEKVSWSGLLSGYRPVQNGAMPRVAKRHLASSGAIAPLD